MILLSAFALVAATSATLGMDPKPPSNAYETLRTAKVFAIGPVGFAATTSTSEMAFRDLLKRPDGAAQFAKLLKGATLEGQMYALLGLRHLDQKAFEAAAPKYRQSKSEIHAVGGCLTYAKTAGQVVADIQEGKVK